MESFLPQAHGNGSGGHTGTQVQGSRIPRRIQGAGEEARRGPRSKKQDSPGNSLTGKPRKGSLARIPDTFDSQVDVLSEARVHGSCKRPGLSQGGGTVSRSSFHTRLDLTQPADHCFTGRGPAPDGIGRI